MRPAVSILSILSVALYTTAKEDSCRLTGSGESEIILAFRTKAADLLFYFAAVSIALRSTYIKMSILIDPKY